MIFKNREQAEIAAKKLQRREDRAKLPERCTYQARKIQFMGYVVDRLDPDGIPFETIETMHPPLK